MEVTSDRQTVLIVEDEPLLRMDAAEAIGAAGYAVLEAGNADEAIDILERRPDISIVFTDIDMPGSMDGLKLSHFVRGRWPPIRIIATSAHSHISERDLPEHSRFIAKPYTPAVIQEAIKAMAA